MNERTIINGQNVNLSKEEQIGVTNFHKSRIAFAVIPKENSSYYLAINNRYAREHRVYLKEDFDITDEIFETLTRGYILPGKINFYVTSYFKPVARELITEALITDLLSIAQDEFGVGEYNIGNGLVVGVPGGEEWPPIEIIRTCPGCGKATGKGVSLLRTGF